jgi:hypothetical protein
MSENEHMQQDKDETVLYPGRLAQYHELRELREKTSPSDPSYNGACIAEQLAGLAYIADGIRYSLRNK